MRKLNSKAGFSFIELVISLAVVGMLMAILMSTQVLLDKEKNRVVNQIEKTTDTTLGERFLIIDLKGVSPSFNTLKFKDDNGASFFDYYPDIPEGFLGKTKEARVFTLEPGKNAFYILYQDLWSGGLLNYDPVAAYEVGEVPADPNVAASLSFISINNKNWISKQRPGFWENGKILFLDTNISVRTKVPLDMEEVPMSPFFLGMVQQSPTGDAFTNLTGLGGVVRSTYSSVDTFFRELPSRGGGQPVVKVRAVKIYRYYLQAYRDDRLIGTPTRLIREEYIKGRFENPLMISDKVGAVKFSRTSVLDKVIQFSIEKLEFKKTN